MCVVQVVPGKPKVDVEVYLCYCTGELCNKQNIAGGAAALTNTLALSVVLVMLSLAFISK